MSRETKDQLDIIKSIKAEGGYAKKWASRFIVGVPDLVGALPGVGNFLVEVKTLGKTLTPKQAYELEVNSNAGGLSFFMTVNHKQWLRIFLYPNFTFSLVCDWQESRYTGIKRCMELLISHRGRMYGRVS